MLPPPTSFTEEIRIILDQCSINSPPVDLGKVARHLGLIYEEHFSPSELEAHIFSLQDKHYAIINTNQTETHRRFTLACLLYYYNFWKDTSRPEVRVRPDFPKISAIHHRQMPLSMDTAS